MLPLLPVAALLYSPTHLPASDARALESPVTVIGAGFDAQATRRAADAARKSLLGFTTPSSVGKRSTEGWVAVVSLRFVGYARPSAGCGLRTNCCGLRTNC